MAEVTTPYLGVNMNNVRKALYYMFFGKGENGEAEKLESENYRYIIPLNASWENPLNNADSKDTYIQYLIESDETVAMDYNNSYEGEGINSYNVQDRIAHIFIRFIGKHAESWSKVMNHLIQRDDIAAIWAGTCNAGMLPYIAPARAQQIDYYGKSTSIAYDMRFALRYKEELNLNWKPLEGIEMSVVGKIDYTDQV